MSKDEFETCLRQNLHRQPFRPFVVQLLDGRRVVVRRLPVVFADGAASFIDPDDGALVDFFHEETQSMGPLEQESPRVTDEELAIVIRAYERRNPFRPYLLEFVSGEKVRVEYRECVAPMVSSVWMYRGQGRTRSVFVSSSVCRVLDIVEAIA